MQKKDDLDIVGQADAVAGTCEPEPESKPGPSQVEGFPVLEATTNETSVTHNNQLDPAFFGRPSSVSPTKISKVFPGTTPPRISTTKHLSPVEEQDTVPPLPKIPVYGFDRVLRFTGASESTSADIKAQPSVQLATEQNDEFEWPDDVF